ncbi:hypothetical protein ACILG0_11920 [Pseudomonadota bacterium AL_CKDN230030165-1A_HGKHYDSX7]
MKHIGKVAEYLVLAELIQRDVEAYSAISFRQPSYDITVIRPDLSVARVQVKGTELQNKSTNNPITNLEKEFDYLVIVVFVGETPQYYILTKREATQAYGNKLGTIYISQMVDRVWQVKPEISWHKDRWEKIIGQCAAPDPKWSV